MPICQKSLVGSPTAIFRPFFVPAISGGPPFYMPSLMFCKVEVEVEDDEFSLDGSFPPFFNGR